MKIRKSLSLLLLLLGITAMHSQERKALSLKDAIEIAITKSSVASLANTKVATSKLELETVKNNLYPSMKISGQYSRLTNASITSNLGSGSTDPNAEPSPSPKPSSLLLGQANLAMPIFSGFRLKNTIIASDNLYKSQTFSAQHSKEQLAMEVVELFANLYKAQEMAKLFEENIKSAQQRVRDFSAMVDNGLMARNDLLKAQLQLSNIQLSLDNAIKNSNIVNYQLVTLLKMEEGTQIEIDIQSIKDEMAKNQAFTTTGQRNDLEALNYQEKASEAGIRIAKSGYYPSLSLVGGYIALDLKDVLTVTNAVNFGVGVSYDLASIFKNAKEVKLAKSKSEQAQKSVEILSDRIKEETNEAQENYTLSIKQNTVYKQANEQGAENYRIVKDKYDNSLSDTNDLLEADVQQLQTKINLALSQADIALKYYQLQFASGKLLNAFNLSQTK